MRVLVAVEVSGDEAVLVMVAGPGPNLELPRKLKFDWLLLAYVIAATRVPSAPTSK